MEENWRSLAWPLFDVFSVLLLIVVYGREQAMTVLGSWNAVVLGVHDESIVFLACFGKKMRNCVRESNIKCVLVIDKTVELVLNF